MRSIRAKAYSTLPCFVRVCQLLCCACLVVILTRAYTLNECSWMIWDEPLKKARH